MTVSVKAPTSTTGSIQLNGSDVLTIDSSGNLTAPNNLTVTGTVSSTGDVAFDTDTLYVDATNNRVGIGTSSPSVKLHLKGASFGSAIRWEETGGNNNFYIGPLDSSGNFGIDNNSSSGYTRFVTNSTERMRIDTNGNLLVGKTTHATLTTSGFNIWGSGSANNGAIQAVTSGNWAAYFARLTNTGVIIHFQYAGADIGNISTNGTATAYNTSSDYRLKESVVPMSDSIDRLKQLKPSTWSWKTDGSHGEGFLAHEAQEVVPEAVTGTKDAMRTEEYEVTPAVLDDDDNVVTEAVMENREVPDYQGIDQSKLVPLLTAALQEAITKIEDLETRIEALEAN